MGKTIAQPNNIFRCVNVNRKGSLILGEDELDLGLPENFLQNSINPKEIFQAFLLLRNGWIEEIELLDNDGFRLHIGSNPSQMLEQAVQMLRKLLERTVISPINIYWSSKYIDLIPI